MVIVRFCKIVARRQRAATAFWDPRLSQTLRLMICEVDMVALIQQHVYVNTNAFSINLTINTFMKIQGFQGIDVVCGERRDLELSP